MYRLKDFLNMKVLDSSGKGIGVIGDITLNFKDTYIEGFAINGNTLFHRNNKVAYTKDIIYCGERMIMSGLHEGKQLIFKDVKGMEVVDIFGNIIGIVEDIIFDVEYKIKGIIVCPGIIKKFYEGKRILLISEVIFGEKNVLFHGSNKLKLISERHRISSLRGDVCNE